MNSVRTYLAILALGAILLLAAVSLARSRLPGRVSRLRGEVEETARQLTTKPESVPASAIDQRFRLRRQAVAAMKSDLLKIAAVESAFVADSGYPTAFLRPPYAFAPAEGNGLPTIQLRVDGWSARIQNDYTAISCAITAQIDTSPARSVASSPTCTGGGG